MQIDEENELTDLFFCLCETCVQVQLCHCALEQADKKTKGKLWFADCWKFWSTGEKRAAEPKRCAWMRRRDLLICFHVFVRLVCIVGSVTVRFKAQSRWIETIHECKASGALRARGKSARLILSDLSWWREGTAGSDFWFTWDVCAKSKAVSSALRHRRDEETQVVIIKRLTILEYGYRKIVGRLRMEIKAKKRSTDPFLCLCKIFFLILKRCCALGDAE